VGVVVAEVEFDDIVITGPEKYVGGYILISTPLDVANLDKKLSYGTM
jgi:hypothetical protein